MGRGNATGTYTINGGTLNVANLLSVGNGSLGSSGNFVHNNGVVTARTMDVGRNNGNGTYTINNGALSITDNISFSTGVAGAMPVVGQLDRVRIGLGEPRVELDGSLEGREAARRIAAHRWNGVEVDLPDLVPGLHVIGVPPGGLFQHREGPGLAPDRLGRVGGRQRREPE